MNNNNKMISNIDGEDYEWPSINFDYDDFIVDYEWSLLNDKSFIKATLPPNQK